MDPSKSTLDPDATEFKPSGLVEKMEAFAFINGLIHTVFDATVMVSEEAFEKLSRVFQTHTIPDIACGVGSSIVRFSIVKPGNAELGFRMIKRLQNCIDPEQMHLLEVGIFEEIHDRSLTIVQGGFLQKMAALKGSNDKECEGSNDIPKVNNHPILIFELLHLIAMCITDLCKTTETNVDIPPCQPCIDLCILADNAFRIQVDSIVKPSPISGEHGDLKSDVKKSNINGWNCLLDVFHSKIAQSLPSFQLLLQYSQDCAFCYSWVSRSALSNEPPNPDPSNVDPGFGYTPLVFSSLLDNMLFRVKRLVVMDGGFPNPWLRSTAVDLLLNASSSIYGYGSNFPTGTHDWRGADKGHVCPEEDDLSIEGLTDSDNPDVLSDFLGFLDSLGQQ